MSSNRRIWLGVLAVAWSALPLGALATPVLAQSPQLDEPGTAFFYAGYEPGAARDNWPVQPTSANFDLATVPMVPLEVPQAEKTQTSTVAPSQPDPKPSEAASDRTLKARWDNGFIAETADKDFRIHLGGRFDFDNCWFNQDGNLLLGKTPDQTMLDGTLMRRARLRADGRLWESIDFACEVNFANIQDVAAVDSSTVQVGSVGLTDFYVTFRDVPWLGNVRVGHLQAPISLERYSSSNAWYYMERSSMFDAFYNPNDYQNGIVVFDSYLDDRVTLAGSVGWVGKSDVQSYAFGANESNNYAAGARVTGLPIYECDGLRLLHLGAGYFHQTFVDDQFSLASRELLRAGAGGTETPNLVNTGTFFSTHGADIANVEGALILGPCSLSSEYAVTRISDVFDQPDFTGPRGDATYQAGYVEGGLFVTPGDHRRYDKKTGTWARTIPEESAHCAKTDCGRTCSYGAVQLVARYTYLDLVSGDPVLTPTSGGARAGRQQDVTLGVNWYLNSQLWVMLDLVETHLASVVPGASGDIFGIGCRLHLDF